jgi:hypothetical protein
MRANIQVLFFLLSLSLSSFINASESSSINIGIACDEATKSDDRIVIHGSMAITGNNDFCIEKHNYLMNAPIERVRVGYLKPIDSYMLFINLADGASKNLSSLTKENVARKLVLVKNDAYVIDGPIESPLVNGIINIAVPNEASGIAIGKLVKKGRSFVATPSKP